MGLRWLTLAGHDELQTRLQGRASSDVLYAGGRGIHQPRHGFRHSAVPATTRLHGRYTHCGWGLGAGADRQRSTDRQAGRQTQADRQADRQRHTGRQTDRQTDRQRDTGRQADRQTYIVREKQKQGWVGIKFTLG